MKVILSRKGFDSQYGKVPSPIFPDGTMLSLPIPSKSAPLTYSEVRAGGRSMGSVVRDLTAGEVPETHRAHLDPDLNPEAVERPSGWRPLFGQVGAAAAHLEKQGVGPGDLFLFFGWFRPVALCAGRWRYVAGTTGVHAIWGWLQVAQTCSPDTAPKDVRRWAATHPHFCGIDEPCNSVYISAERFRLGTLDVTGAGVFPFAERRVLTSPGKSRSRWRLPAWMHPGQRAVQMSYHLDADRWSGTGQEFCELQSVAKGQEFVIQGDRERLQDWVVGLW